MVKRNLTANSQILYIFISIFFILFVLFFVFIFVDSMTVKEIGTKSVKCVDDVGNKFQNEMCDKKIRCSWLGLVEEKRCSEVNK